MALPSPTIPSSSSASAPPWIELPHNLTENILLRLDIIDIMNSAEQVCVTWKRVCEDPQMWRAIDLRKLDLDDAEKIPYEIICRRAVDRSQGGLRNLRIEDFGSESLFQYISERCLVIAVGGSYDDVSNKCLTELITKCPHLEELHLKDCQQFSVKDIQAIARCCPYLKSLSLPRTSAWNPDNSKDTCDISAKVIAQNMPGLLRLRLFNNNITNVGLEAFLDGCSNLVFLDLRECHNVDLKGELGKRCMSQIKEVRYHNNIGSQVYEYEPVDEWAVSHYNMKVWLSECSLAVVDNDKIRRLIDDIQDFQ